MKAFYLTFALILSSLGAWAAFPEVRLPLQPLDVVNPIGDETLGLLKVQSPGYLNKIPRIAPFSINTKPELKIAIDKTNRVLQGSYCLNVQLVNEKATSTRCNIDVVAKQTTTVALSALQMTWDPNILRTDVGPHASLLFKGKSNNFSFQVLDGKAGIPLKDEIGSGPYWPMLADTIEASSPELPLFGAFPVNLKDGEVRSEKLPVQEWRAAVAVIPAERSYADPGFLQKCNFQGVINVIQRKNDSPGEIRFHTPRRVNVDGRFDTSGPDNYVDSFNIHWQEGGTVHYFPTVDGKNQALL